MSLPNPIPDNPLKWDGWRNYNSPDLYARLCLEHTGNFSTDIIEENTRMLLVWWQKKLPLKNQPSNPMAQLLRQGLDEAPQFLAEARTRLLDTTERTRHNKELHEQLVGTAIKEFKKLLTFTITENRLTEDGEARLHAAGSAMGLRVEDMIPVIDAELERTGSARVKAEPVAPPPSVPLQPVPLAHVVAPLDAQGPFNEFKKILRMSRLCLDGEEMSDDQRDAMCNLGESLGLTGGQAEDLIDEYQEDMQNAPIPATPSASAHHPSQALVRTLIPPPTSVRLGTTPTVKRVINLSPVALADEKRKFPNYKNTLELDMFLIPTGLFRMGSGTADAQANELPATPVTLTCFYMARFPITNAAYEKFDPTHRAKRGAWANDNHPVIHVSAAEAEAFCKWLSQREGRKYRLPTEAEWEYAARGGEVRIFPWGDRNIAGHLANLADSRTQFAWRDTTVDDGFAETSPVGTYPRGASPFGIEDMAGNVFEWTLDAFEPYKGRELTNPRVLKQTLKRVYRGGSWKSRISSLRCCARNSNLPSYQSNDVGFRIVCECD